MLVLLVSALPLRAEIIWSEQQDFYVDPPIGWIFYEDPTPQHFLIRNSDGSAFLEIFNQSTQGAKADPANNVTEKAKTVLASLGATGEGELFSWSGQQSWLGNLTYKAGPYPVRAILLVTRNQSSYMTALAYCAQKDFDNDLDVLQSALNSLALGEAGRKDIGPLSAYFRETAPSEELERKALTGLPSSFTMTYSKTTDESIQAVMERESRVVAPMVQTRFLNAAWSRFYRQIYRELFSSLLPLSQYWSSLVPKGTVSSSALPQTMMSWVQSFEYSRKGGVTDLSSPWQTLSNQSGDCDSRCLLYLALLEQTGTKGILMVSSKYSHAMAALELSGAGARFPMDKKNWLVAELTDNVNKPALGMIPQEYSDPNQWLGIDLWGKP
jgi:hypothetical protein